MTVAMQLLPIYAWDICPHPCLGRRTLLRVRSVSMAARLQVWGAHGASTTLPIVVEASAFASTLSCAFGE